MTWYWGILIGFSLGVLCLTPLVRWLLRRAELRARQAERRARNSERLAELGSMTSGLAHEIKNPLSTVGLNAQLLREGINDADYSDEQRQRLLNRLDSLAREVERLSDILADFLQFAGRMKLDPQPHNLAQIITELSDFFHPQCDQEGVVLRTSLPSSAITVSVDETLFKQALLNLMINAVQAMKTTDTPADQRGELMLRLDENDEEVSVHIIDTGPGIPPEKLEEIFHPYVSHKAGGTGLGLPTTKRIVEEHGGRITAHSEFGRGSDFVITLPHK